MEENALLMGGKRAWEFGLFSLFLIFFFFAPALLSPRCLLPAWGVGGICVDASMRPLAPFLKVCVQKRPTVFSFTVPLPTSICRHVYTNSGSLVECKGPWTGSQKTWILVLRLPLTQHVILEKSQFFAIPKMRALV